MMSFVRFLSRLLTLLLPATLMLLAGLAVAWCTGQADPWCWGWPAMLLLVPTGWWLARRDFLHALWMGLGGAGMVLLFCALAAARMPDPWAMIGLLLLALAAAGGGALLWQRRRLPACVALAAALLLLGFGPARPISSQPDRPVLAVITALPLFWEEGGAGTRRDAPIVTLLRSRFEVRPIDDVRALAASGAPVLLLAQPRPMTPQALVALDRWVRDGGRLLLLTDPHLRWPSGLPLGDRRRAPMVGTLGPLLAHWGVRGGAVRDREIRHFLPDGRLLTMAGMQPLSSGGRQEVAVPLPLRIGRGEVLLLGDADLIDDRLWLADPARPLDPRAWSADTPALVAQWLGAEMPDGRRWMRDVADVRLGLRSALLAGTGWAILGLMLLRRRSGRNGMRTKSENKLVKGGKNG
ncbi:Gldg family protein [Sphingobium yanoikuyae]|uniref:Gldg family protein n=1 Tax=Sphingobium yanoikuyae TaxID=13690 RepID=UPI00084646F6|nr:Gldg family protein [Sphingobium yanoikuyae]